VNIIRTVTQRWVLLNNPSCLMYRLHIIILHCGPWNAVETRTLVLFWRDFFFLSQEGQEVGGGRDPYGNREQEQKHTETATVSQCFRNTFPEHLLENPSLFFLHRKFLVFLVFGLLYRHTASNSITSETHTSGAQ